VVNCKENLGRAAVAFKLGLFILKENWIFKIHVYTLWAFGFKNLGVQKLISSKKMCCSKKLKFKESQKKKLFGLKAD
jgi:hypothetical protein